MEENDVVREVFVWRRKMLIPNQPTIQWYKSRDDLLRDELLCFRTLLVRAQRLPEVQLERVLRRVNMFDSLLEEDPWVKGKVAEGELKGELKASRSILQDIVNSRFPSLSELAKAKADQITQPEALNVLIVRISLAVDEHAARGILEAYPPLKI
jgi:hypothetical protein